MITVKQIERLFISQQHRKLYGELAANRPEGSFGLEFLLARSVPTAAMALVRLDELSQSHAPLCRRLLNVLLTSQQRDGGWGDPVTTALCVRALMCGDGQGDAIDRGLMYLVHLQKAEGIWPSEPIRRMPADATASAFVLLQLGDDPRFREAVRFDDAIHWFAEHGPSLEQDERRSWERAAIRCRVAPDAHAGPTLWSATRPAA